MNKCIALFLLIISQGGFSQKKVFNRDFSIPEKTPLLLSYYGNLSINPGLKIGFDYSVFLKEKTKDKKRKTKTIRKNLLISPSLAFYSHANSHTAFLLSADVLWRRYTKRLLISEFGVGFGYYQRINSGITYEVTPAGINEIKGTNGYFATTYSYSFGKRFCVKGAIPTEIFLKTNYHLILGYNAAVGSELSSEIGIRMALNFGLKQGKTKTVFKTK